MSQVQDEGEARVLVARSVPGRVIVPMPEREAGRGRTDVLLVLAVALGVAILYATLDVPLFWDEYYHLLAARSWAADGTLAIADGVYGRVSWYTVSLGFLYRLFGESLFVARLMAGAILGSSVVAVFLWTRHIDGRTAGWIAALLLLFSPMVLRTSGMVRFYGAQALLFWVGAAVTYLATVGGYRPGRRTLLVTVAATSLLASAMLTPISLLGVGAVALWLVGSVMVSLLGRGRRRTALALAVGLVVMGLVVLSTGYGTDSLESLRWAPVWGHERADAVRWYHWVLREDYPTLWPLLPVAALVAIRRSPRAAWLCVLVLSTVVGGHSLAAAKAERYISYVMPFFFVLWGVAIADLLPAIRRLARDVAAGVSAHRRGVAKSLEWVMLAGTGLFVVASNSAFPEMARILTGGQAREGIPPSAWEFAADSIGSLSRQAAVVVTPNSLHALYYVGEYDFEMRATVIPEASPPEEFGTDTRTGRLVISNSDSMRELMSRHATGLVYAERSRWRHSFEGITNEVADLLEGTAERVPMPAEWGVVAYRWSRPPS